MVWLVHRQSLYISTFTLEIVQLSLIRSWSLNYVAVDKRNFLSEFVLLHENIVWNSHRPFAIIYIVHCSWHISALSSSWFESWLALVGSIFMSLFWRIVATTLIGILHKIFVLMQAIVVCCWNTISQLMILLRIKSVKEISL